MDNQFSSILPSILTAHIDKKSPPPESTGFKPPKKGGNRKVREPSGPKEGWLDRDGNVWVPDDNMHGGEGWTVQHKNGRGHHHVYPDGRIRTAQKQSRPGWGAVTIVASGAAVLYLILNDVTGVGVADDGLIAPAFAGVYVGWDMINGMYYCEVCGQRW